MQEFVNCFWIIVSQDFVIMQFGYFTKFVNSNQLPYITLHGLRHTHTAMMASMTDDITQISRRLGHSQISTTMNIYTHLFKDNDRDLADMISEKYSIIGGKENE